MTRQLDDAEVRRLLRLEELIPALRRAFIDLSAGRAVQPLRLVMELPSEHSLLFLKPALAGGALAVMFSSARFRWGPMPLISSSGLAAISFLRLTRCEPIAKRCASSRSRCTK